MAWDTLKRFSVYILIIINLSFLLFIYLKSYDYLQPQSFIINTTPGDWSNKMLNNYETIALAQSENYEKLKNMTYDVAERLLVTEIVEIVHYNVSRPLPKETDGIECILLKNANPPYNVCLHNNNEDVFLSGGLRQNLAWETIIQGMIKDFFLSNRKATFVDLGSNIGVHSLFAAAVHNDVQVVAVEPFPKNVIRIHKAAQMNNVQDRFKVVMVPVSNKRGPVTFYETQGNVGGNGILIKPAEVGVAGFTSKSIIFDDLTPFIEHKTVFLKMDIEAAECHVFANAYKFFDEIDVRFIVMEILYTKAEGACCFEGMLKFLKERNYKAFSFPYRPQNKDSLNFLTWKEWNQGEIYFQKF